MSLIKSLFILSVAAVSLMPQAWSQRIDLDQRISTTISSSSAGIFKIVGERDGKQLITRVEDIPEGTVFSFIPSRALVRPIVTYPEGKADFYSPGRYYGSIIVDTNSVSLFQRRRFSELNREQIFIYEWHTDKAQSTRELFDIPSEKSSLNVADRFEWDEIITRGSWTNEAAHLMKTVGADLLSSPPSDVEDFCPNYYNQNTDGKTAFWIHLINSIAKRESRFDPLVQNDESGFGSSDLNVISRGLLQISHSSSRARSYRQNGCDVRNSEDLHDVSTNLRCGIAIFKHLVSTSDCISCRNSSGRWAGIAAYWSTLRERHEISCRACSRGVTNVGYKAEIASETAQTPSCRI
jgi:hypothetical protein